MRLDHAIFNTPLNAEVVLEPNDWEKEFDPRGTWLVQTGELGSGKGNDYGVVSDGHGFEDSPDCERISGGINSKGPYAVAIGRQANLLQWGFYAAPDRMTASAKKVFRNAIVYMKQFDGQRPLVEKKARGRGWYDQYVAMVRKLPAMDEKLRDSYQSYLKRSFPAAVIAKVGMDADALDKWLQANVEYIYAAERYKLDVDDDLKQLKLSNRKPEFLDWITAKLTSHPKNELALKLARRYLGENGDSAKAAIAWIRKNRKRLFFSDQGGFRWLCDTSTGTAKPAIESSTGKPQVPQKQR